MRVVPVEVNTRPKTCIFQLYLSTPEAYLALYGPGPQRATAGTRDMDYRLMIFKTARERTLGERPLWGARVICSLLMYSGYRCCRLYNSVRRSSVRWISVLVVSRSRCASFSNWRTRERWGSVSVSFVVPKFVVLIMDFS